MIVGKLVLFNRKMPFSSDDCLIGSIKLIMDSILCIANIILFIHAPIDCHLIYYYLLYQIIILSTDWILGCAILWTSLQGTVSYSEPRKHMPKLLYAALIALFLQSCLIIYGIYAFNYNQSCSQSQPFYGFALFLLICLTLATIINITVYSIAFLSSRSIYMHQSEIYTHVQRVIHPIFSFSTFMNRNNPINPKLVLQQVAELISEIIQDEDLTVSDVLAGLVLVQKRRQIEDMTDQIIMDSSSRSRSQSLLYNVDNGIRQRKDSIESNFMFKALRLGKAFIHYQDPIILNLKKIAYISQYVEAIYGLPVFIWADCFQGCGYLCCPQTSDIDSPVSALEKTIDTGCKGLLCCCPGTWVKNKPHPDLLYTSIKGSLFKSPFAICIDRKLSAIIICIRGSLSTTDLLVDLLFKEQEIKWIDKNSGQEMVGYCHAGMYEIALNIFNEIKQNGWFVKLENEYGLLENLIVTGHSLGAGVSALLSFIIKNDPTTAYFAESTSCLAYSAPGFLISATAIPYFQTFCSSIVLGEDFVCRMNQLNCHILKHQIRLELENCNIRKADILSILVNQLFERKVVDNFDLPHLSPIPDYSGPIFYLPGNVLHLKRIVRGADGLNSQEEISLLPNENIEDYDAFWVDSVLFSEYMAISKLMVFDHFPNIVGDVLRSLYGNYIE